MTSAVDWIAVDWGTSNLRAWGVKHDGEVAFMRSSDQGMGKLTREAYPEVLKALLEDEIETQSGPLSVLICGMAGARQGWLEAPYLEAPADLGGLAFAAVSPEVAGSRLVPKILPGVCQKQNGDDVMRGEETQLLGLSALKPGFSGVVCMPGTHSKWAQLDGRKVERFTTVMTGELYEILRTHSVLRHSLTGDLDGPERAEGFDAGLTAGLDAPEKLSATLFKVRAGSLLSGRTPSWCAGYLSGLLIGTEIGGQRDWITDAEIPLIGGGALCALYAQGLAKIGAKGQVVDATEATIAGLKAARQQLN